MSSLRNLLRGPPLPHRLGTEGERYAARYLSRCGYRIVRKNWHGPSGEADIIAIKNGALVVVEVKTRSQRSAEIRAPLDAINSQKRRRLYRLAEQFYSKHRCDLMRYRIRRIQLETLGICVMADGQMFVTHEHDDDDHG